jgi:hypothetical protein
MPQLGECYTQKFLLADVRNIRNDFYPKCYMKGNVITFSIQLNHNKKNLCLLYNCTYIFTTSILELISCHESDMFSFTR